MSKSNLKTMKPNPKTNWKEQAAKILKEGYIKGSWDEMFRRHLNRCWPNLVAEFRATGDLEAYIIVKVHSAVEEWLDLTDAGTEPMLAKELVFSELFQENPDDEEEGDEEESEEEDGELQDSSGASEQAGPEEPVEE